MPVSGLWTSWPIRYAAKTPNHVQRGRRKSSNRQPASYKRAALPVELYRLWLTNYVTAIDARPVSPSPVFAVYAAWQCR